MLNSSFFLKQLGYIVILKYWNIYFKDTSDKTYFPKFITPKLAEHILKLTEIESSELKKEMDQELKRMKSVLELEVSSKMKEKINLKRDPSQQPTDVFQAIRILIKTDQVTEKALIDGASKIDHLINEKAALHSKESGELSASLFPRGMDKKGITETTKGKRIIIQKLITEPQDLFS